MTGGRNGPSKAKNKFMNSRVILSQNTDQSLKDGKLDVPGFVAARSFEIEQMEAAMKRSKSAGKQRAFQSLPLFLRRRAASHNVKRVPHRIRKRAATEMATDTPLVKTKVTRGHKKEKLMATERALQQVKRDQDHDESTTGAEDNTGVNELAQPPTTKNVKYQKRQKSKVWTPTHVWHTKRAHLVEKWGYSVVESPTEKVYRATHRIHNTAAAIAWDTSYFGDIVLDGEINDLKTAVEKLLGPGAIQTRVIQGRIAWEGQLTVEDQHYGPVLVYWSYYDDGGYNEEGQVLFHVHPAIFNDLYRMLEKLQKRPDLDFGLHDCRYSLGSIDIAGSKSLFALSSILHDREAQDPVIVYAKSVANNSFLPSNAVFTLEVDDPRTYSPHHIGRPSENDDMNKYGRPNWFDTMPSNLLKVEARKASYKNQCSIKHLNDRRSQTTPGEPIPILYSIDPLVPVIVIKRADDSFTLLLPWHWVLPFWLSLVKVDKVRLGGLRQMHQLAFEQGRPFFPNDYPLTPAGIASEQETSQKVLQEWERRPPAKRVNYSAIQVSTSETGEIGKFYSNDWDYLASKQNTTLDKLELVTVHVKYIDRGTPKDRARIYRIPEGDEDAWKSKDEVKPDCPKSDMLIGYITTGGFNLQQGGGSGVGSILSGITSNLCLVRNSGSTTVRLAKYYVPL